MMLDSTKRLRVPKIKIRASRDGYNLSNMYNYINKYVGSYKNAILLINSKKGFIFGCYID